MASTSPSSQGAPNVSELSYEDARSQLVEIVAQLEQGSLPLEDSLALWSAEKRWPAAAKSGWMARVPAWRRQRRQSRKSHPGPLLRRINELPSVIGEALVDIITGADGKATRHPGGSMLNVRDRTPQARADSPACNRLRP